MHPTIIIFLHYLYKYFSDKGNDIESMHNDKTLDYVLFSIRDCSLTLTGSRGFSVCEDFYNRAYIVFAKHLVSGNLKESKKYQLSNDMSWWHHPMKTSLMWDPILDMFKHAAFTGRVNEGSRSVILPGRFTEWILK